MQSFVGKVRHAIMFGELQPVQDIAECFTDQAPSAGCVQQNAEISLGGSQ